VKESERRQQNRKKTRIRRKRWEEGKWRRRRRRRRKSYIPTNRETCVRVFSYVWCVVPSRRFRVLSCEASRRDASRRSLDHLGTRI